VGNMRNGGNPDAATPREGRRPSGVNFFDWDEGSDGTQRTSHG